MTVQLPKGTTCGLVFKTAGDLGPLKHTCRCEGTHDYHRCRCGAHVPAGIPPFEMTPERQAVIKRALSDG